MSLDPQPPWATAHRLRVGARLRAARTDARLSQERLGELAGIDRKTVVRAEAGQVDLKLSAWLALARALGVPLADLVRE